MVSPNVTRSNASSFAALHPGVEMLVEGRPLLALSFFSIFLSTVVFCFGKTDGDFGILCKENERQALLRFKQGLSDPTGRLSTWKDEEDCCSWEGVHCSNETGHVLKLQLRNPSSDHGEEFSYLSGEINPSLLELRQLRYLDLSRNRFKGISIPQFIGSLTSLRYLNLSDAQFGGMIPHQLGNLSGLQYLDFRGSMDLAVDNLQWLSHLYSIRYLDMMGLNLSTADIFYQVHKLSKLSVLRLSSCNLERIPSSLSYDNFTFLTILDLSQNNLGPEIPGWLFNISSLQSLDLSFNQFNSTRSSFGKLTSLQVLQVGQNYFKDTTFWNIENICQLSILDFSNNNINEDILNLEKHFTGCVKHSLRTLDLQGNSLSGQIPVWIGELRNLESLHLGSNLLFGVISPSLGDLSSLRYLYLGNNTLEGSIPEYFGQFSQLVVLDVGFNKLSGIVSDVHFSNITKLEALFLSSNSLVLNFSSGWRPQFQLKNVHLSSCVIGPEFPVWLRTQRMFSTIDLSNGSISATMPDWFWNLSSRVFYMNLSHNQISGVFPEAFTFTNVFIIDLQSNQFHGSLPYIGDGVHYLYLSDNVFSGDLHPIFNKTIDLWSVSLSNNHITGSIPPYICGRITLVILDLSSNLLSGEIPECSVVGGNYFSVINFANNNLSGEIPQWIGTQIYLQSLHLNNNSLHGEIPSFENCTDMYVLDLGENRLKGSIPSWIGESLTNLKILRLRSNMLNGGIPEQLAGLARLQVLDLANNKLSGRIPPSLANLSSMVLKDKASNGLLSIAEYDDMVDYVSVSLFGIYTESLFVTIKGRGLQYSKTLSLLVCLDLSENNLSGQIPDSLTNLLGLQSLNLSGNLLTVSIPSKIGNLSQLESLDLSNNLLNGSIPPSLSSLNYLSYLNLSYNNLSGRIPVGNQLQSLTDPTIYAGNPNLCGTPSMNKCLGDEVPPGASAPAHDARDGGGLSEGMCFYIGAMVGLVAGFWILCGALLLNKSWRISYFRFVAKMTG